MPTIYKNGLVYGGSAGTANLIQATDVNGGTSNVQAELDKLNTISFNPAINHNNIYRGIMLVDTVDNTGKYTLTQLHNLVTAGDFSDIYIGDIIKVNMAATTYTPSGGSSTTAAAQDVEWIVMGINRYLHRGSTSNGRTKLEQNHLILVPKDCFNTKAHANPTNTTSGGFAGSDLYTNILPAYVTNISNSLGGYIIQYQQRFSDQVNESTASSAYSAKTGAASHSEWMPAYVHLMGVEEVMGTNSWLSSGYSLCGFPTQLPGFRLNPSLIYKKLLPTDSAYQSWWTITDVWNTSFARISESGSSYYQDASAELGVVPKVLFG